ncbi:3934_t:CDS:1, partial [Ambispora leptoticha]
NRFWCTCAIPELWKNPFRTPKLSQTHHLKYIIEIYLKFLSREQADYFPQCIRDKYLIHTSFLCFPYPSYLQRIDIVKINLATALWLRWRLPNSLKNSGMGLLLIKELAKMLDKYTKSIEGFVCSVAHPVNFFQISIEGNNHRSGLFRLKKFICHGDYDKTQLLIDASKVSKKLKELEVSIIKTFDEGLALKSSYGNIRI